MIRSRDDVWIEVGEGRNRRIVLTGDPARYLRVTNATFEALTFVAAQKLGTTVGSLRLLFPSTDFEDMVRLKLVDVVPVAGVDPRKRLVWEMWRRNVASQVAIRRFGWSAIARWMAVPDIEVPFARPLLFDEIEAAARISFAFPGTSRQCTVVALQVLGALRARNVHARIVVIAEGSQSFMHSFVLAGSHVVDPGDTNYEVGSLVRLGATGHHVGDSRLTGGRPVRAPWGRS